jgi:uncharacterized protein (DUF924 family)
LAATPQDVLGFWRQAGPRKWFARDARFDAAIRLKFEPTHHAAARGEYDGWAATAEGALALLILLDQFPRNLYRESAHAFATDPKALAIAREAIEIGHDQAMDVGLRPFFYMPFEHSEDLADQALSLTFFRRHCEASGDAEPLKWAELHEDIIGRFGRFPHRNRALGRATSEDEQAFLDEGGFAG